MKKDLFDEIKNMYGESFYLHGDSPASLLTPKGRQSIRFRALDPFFLKGKMRILDYGCGLGYLYQYLLFKGYDFEYIGVDIMPEFIEVCREKFPKGPDFQVIDPQTKIQGSYDIVFASGVFNLKTNDDLIQSKLYAYKRINALFDLTKEAFVCDFLSPFVDFQQPSAQHFEIGEISDYCAKSLSRRFMLRHDLLPYEFTLIVYKDSSIQRPENIFKIDASNY